MAMPSFDVDNILPHDERRAFIRNPRTQFRVMLAILSLTWVTWIFGLISVTGCTFVKSGEEDVSYSDMDTFGLFSEPVYNDHHKILGCIKYDSHASYSGTFKMARVAGIILAMSLSLAFVLVNGMVLFMTHHGLRRLSMFVVRWLFPIALGSSFVMYLVHGVGDCAEDGYKCPPGGVGIVAIFNTVFLVIATVIIFLVPASRQPAFVFVWGTSQGRYDLPPETSLEDEVREQSPPLPPSPKRHQKKTKKKNPTRSNQSPNSHAEKKTKEKEGKKGNAAEKGHDQEGKHPQPYEEEHDEGREVTAIVARSDCSKIQKYSEANIEVV